MRSRLRTDGNYTAALFALALVLGALLYLYVGRDTNFYYDEWSFVLERRGWDIESLLRAHNSHLSLLPVLIYKIYFEIFGLGSYLPYRLTGLIFHLACVTLLFVFARRRLPDSIAWIASLSLLFLGSAFQDILWPFQIGYMGSLAAGLGVLLLLERHEQRGDLAACALLVVSLAFSGIGVAFLVAAAVDVLWKPDRLRRLWLIGAPLIAFLAWYVSYGDSGITRENIFLAPQFAADMAAGALGGLSGLDINWGRPLAVGALAALFYSIVKANRLTRMGAILLAVPLVFWSLTALSRASLGEPGSSRYIYPGVVAVLLIATEFSRNLRFRVAATACLSAVLAVAVAANLAVLRAGAKGLRETDQVASAELSALELVRDKVKPDFQPDSQRMPQVRAGAYLDAVNQLGSPAYSVSELLSQPEAIRVAADNVLVKALAVGFQTERKPRGPLSRNFRLLASSRATAKRRKGCLLLRPRGLSESDLKLNGLDLLITSRTPSPVEVRVRRFASEFPSAATATFKGPGASALVLPRLNSAVPWTVRLSARSPISICAYRSSFHR